MSTIAKVALGLMGRLRPTPADRSAIADALGLTHDQHVLLSHTVGHAAGHTGPHENATP